MLIFGNIRKGLKEAEATRGSLLVDVREAGEYAMGHIPGAVNAPLSALSEAASQGQAAVSVLPAREPEP